MGLDWLNPIGAVIGGVGSIYGLLQGEREKRDAQAAQAAAIRNYQTSVDSGYQQNLLHGAQSLLSQSGYGVDALRNLGAGMGGALAAGGVYNPSAVAGALTSQQLGQQQSLTDLASRLSAQAIGERNQGLQNIANMQLGAAGQNLGQANTDIGGAAGGLQSFLQSITQANLARSGANAYRVGQPQMNGTQGQGIQLPGNSGWAADHPITSAAFNASGMGAPTQFHLPSFPVPGAGASGGLSFNWPKAPAPITSLNIRPRAQGAYSG